MGLPAKLRRLLTWPRRAYRRRTDPVGYARSLGVRVGERCRFLGRVHFGTEPYLITIGDRVSISDGVLILTHDGGVWAIRQESPDADIFDPVTIGNNVFIGARVTLLPGAVIGDNCVIGTGSVVVGEVPPNSVAAGIPARVIRPIEEYRAKCRDRALHVRSLPRDVLKHKLMEHFGLDENDHP